MKSEELRRHQRQQLWIGVYSKMIAVPEVEHPDAAGIADTAVDEFDKAFPAPTAPDQKGCTKCRCEQCVQQPRFPGRFPWTAY